VQKPDVVPPGVPSAGGVTVDFALAMGIAAAAQQSSPSAVAGAVLEELCRHLPVAAATLVSFDPFRGSHVVLGSVGYRPEVLDHLTSPAFLVDDVGYRLLVRRPQRRARSWCDVELEYYERSPSVTEVFGPAGFAGGATARLVSTDGRYTGDLHLNTYEQGRPAPGTTAALHHVAPVLAAATDVTRRLSFLLGDRAPDVPAVVVSGKGTLVPVPDRKPPVQLVGDPDLVAGIVAWRESHPGVLQARFHLCRAAGWFQTQLAAVEGGTLVSVRPVPAPHGLTLREMQVLTLLTEGLANVAIGRRLGISARTTAHHVEHVLTKLEVQSRAAATRCAVEQGLRLLPAADSTT
jgi:DNA-binding CsgD family transcriptional regulator